MTQPITANQLVAYNLARIRKALGLSQEQAAELLEPYLGERWSKAVYSAAERSYHGKRVRHFTADDLAALALAFGVPVTYFLLPPRPDDRPADAAFTVGTAELPWSAPFDVMFGGQNRTVVSQRVFELPPGERPTPRSHASEMVTQLSAMRHSIWDKPTGPITADDPRLRMAEWSGTSNAEDGDEP